MRRQSTRAIGGLLGLSLALALAAQVNLQLTFHLVRHPVALAAANLEPNPQVVREWYAVLMEQGTYLWMIRTELVDILWAILLGAVLTMITYFAGACLRRRSPGMSEFLMRWAPLSAIGPLFDVIENCLSLAMLTDPWGFPDPIAVLHVVASSLKFALITVTSVTGLTLTVVAAVRGTGAIGGKARDESEAVSSR